ncbi:23123_t:CDS:1, partial [Racocetra persica]
LHAELKKYLLLPLEDNSDPLVWWQAQKEYPILCLIARDYLAIQATSVASEQVFSIAGLTISTTRARLEDESAKAILCLKSWLQKGICKLD